MDNVPVQLEVQFARARVAPSFVDLPLAEALDLAVNSTDSVRVFTLDEGPLRVRQDHRPKRLNLLVRRGRVIRAAYF